MKVHLARLIGLATIVLLGVAIIGCSTPQSPQVPVSQPTAIARPANSATARAIQAPYLPTPTEQERKELPKCSVSSVPLPTPTPNPTPGFGVNRVAIKVYSATYKCVQTENDRVATLVIVGDITTFKGFEPRIICPTEVYDSGRLGPYVLQTKSCVVISELDVDLPSKTD